MIFFQLISFVVCLFFLGCSSKIELVRIPMEFLSERGCSCIGSACIRVKIDGNPLFLALDTGAFGELVLRSKATNITANKELVGCEYTFDVKGNKYKKDIYMVESIALGNGINFKGFIMREDDERFLVEGSNINFSEETEEELKADHEYLERIDGRFCIGFLSRLKNCIIDFKDSSITWVKKNGKNFDFPGVKIKWEEFAGGIIAIPILTDFGVKKFILDTGADWTIIKPISREKDHEVLMSQKFVVNQTDFGPTKLAIYEFSSLFGDVDGILGRDFFMKYTVYLDFENQTAWIRESETRVKE